ncbi:hypothetical protein [Tabrizicola sp. YIM 78059]|uniref:hypothetical protein n=1 Tax=Tabrizicola sp. YIM 78059 TaxID=2529861 RepID=UPI0010AA8EDF|nr:hypothetical protein [Tabrizicola sp. YIM 78059]
MILLSLILMLFLTIPADAETARVLSGEHADFTRLVVQLPAQAGWRVGRTPLGYAFATENRKQPDYDLAHVWDRIPRKRLQALRADPETGILEMTLACECHLFPFEYQPGVIVLDIRSGPPPEGSIFEAPFSGFAFLRDEKPGSDPGAPVTFDWLDARNGGAAGAHRYAGLTFAREKTLLEPLRAELLEQISRGAAAGVVDMRLSGTPAGAMVSEGDPDLARIRLGEMPGLDVLDPNAPRTNMQPDGSPCLADADLAIGDWGAGRAALDLLAEARTGLFGEFDAVRPEAVLNSVRLHLYLGFGAEARQYATLATGLGDELRLLVSITRLVDGDPDPEAPFAPMLACDGAAAFWAALAHDRLPAGSMVNIDAVVRTFLGLPPHLRSLFGPRLALLLIDLDAEAARRIRNAMERTPHVPAQAVSLLDARMELQADHPERARFHAEAALSDPRHEVDALVALVEAHFLELRPIPGSVVERVQSLQGQTGNNSSLARAVALSFALSGRFDEAFAIAEPGAMTADIWRVLAALGDDDDLLVHAVRPAPLPSVKADVALSVAKRLQVLGFPDAALVWLGPIGPDAPTEYRLVAAAAELARGDAGRALQHLATLEGQTASDLRAAAQTRLGFLDAARTSLQKAGRSGDAQRLSLWAEDWNAVAAAATEPWSAAAAMAQAAIPEGGPLARGAALLNSSSATRAALTALLGAVPPPSP